MASTHQATQWWQRQVEFPFPNRVLEDVLESKMYPGQNMGLRSGAKNNSKS